MAEMPAGVAVITSWDADRRPVGTTVSAASSLSLEPAMLLVCLAGTSETYRALARRGEFIVNILADAEEELAGRLAVKGTDKFDGADWTPGLHDLPELAGCVLAAGCDVARMHPGGDHGIVLGLVRKVEMAGDAVPLVYHRRQLVGSPVAAQLRS